MTDPKALAQEIKRFHVLQEDGTCGECADEHGNANRWPCDAVRAADALLEVAEDKARLDWLERLFMELDESPFAWGLSGETFRAAIDAALNSAPSTPSRPPRRRAVSEKVDHEFVEWLNWMQEPTGPFRDLCADCGLHRSVHPFHPGEEP